MFWTSNSIGEFCLFQYFTYIPYSQTLNKSFLWKRNPDYCRNGTSKKKTPMVERIWGIMMKGLIKTGYLMLSWWVNKTAIGKRDHCYYGEKVPESVLVASAWGGSEYNRESCRHLFTLGSEKFRIRNPGTECRERTVWTPCAELRHFQQLPLPSSHPGPHSPATCVLQLFLNFHGCSCRSRAHLDTRVEEDIPCKQ
jgi:hypothetical protein